MSSLPLWMDLFWFPIVVLALFGYGHWMSRAVDRLVFRVVPSERRNRSALEELVYTLGFGFGLTILFEFLIGWFGLLYFPVHAGFVLIGSLFGIHRMRKIDGRQLWNEIRPDNKIGILLLTLILMIMAFHFLGCFVPAIGADDTVYHLTFPRQCNLFHRIIPTPHIIHTNYSIYAHLVYLLGLGLGSEMLCKMLLWIELMGILLTLYSWVRRESQDRSSLTGYLAVLFYLSAVCGAHFRAPLEAGSDILTGFFITLAFYSLSGISRENYWKPLVIASIFQGLAWGTKYTAFAFGTIPLLALFAAQVIRYRIPWNRAMKGILLIFTLSFILFFPIAYKNYVYTHNPIYFLGHQWMKSPPPYDRMAERFASYESRFSYYGPALPHAPDNPSPSLISGIFKAVKDYYYFKMQKPASQGDLLLPLFFIFSFTGWFVGGARIRVLACAGLTANLLFILLYASEIHRFFTITYSLAALLAALHVHELLKRMTFGKSLTGILIGLLLFLNLTYQQFIWSTNEHIRWWGKPLLTRQAQDAFLRARNSYSDILEIYIWMRTHLPPDSYIVGHGVTHPFHCPRKIYAIGEFEDDLIDLLMEKYPADPEKVKEELQRQGFTHLLRVLRENEKPLPASWPECFGAPIQKAKRVELYSISK